MGANWLKEENMKILFFLLLCLPVSVAAQDRTPAASEQSVVLDVRIIDLEVMTTDEMEKLSRDKTKLEQMIAQGKAKVVAGTQLQAMVNQSNSVRVGQRVPVQSQSLATGAGASVPQVQYENTGLSLTFTPRLLANDSIEIKFNLDITAVDRDTGSLTPTFVNRQINGTARLKAGESTMFFGLTQGDALMPKTGSQTDKSITNPVRGNFCVLLRARIQP